MVNPNIIANTVRFIEQLKLKSSYLYIGDIDLLVLENVLDIHLDLIDGYSLPFSNIIRGEDGNLVKKRLTGLHFVRYEDYYPISNIDDLDLSVENDEYVLYEIMNRKGIMVPVDFQIRPDCGIHMSLSRDPIGRTTGPSMATFRMENAISWGGIQEYSEKVKRQIRGNDFNRLMPYLDLRFRQLLLMLEAIIDKKCRAIHRLSVSYLVDKRLDFYFESIKNIKDFLKKRSDLLKDENYEEALRLGCASTMIWPNNIDIWYKQAYLYFILKREVEAAEAISHLIELDGGVDFLKSNQFS